MPTNKHPIDTEPKFDKDGNMINAFNYYESILANAIRTRDKTDIKIKQGYLASAFAPDCLKKSDYKNALPFQNAAFWRVDHDKPSSYTDPYWDESPSETPDSVKAANDNYYAYNLSKDEAKKALGIGLFVDNVSSHISSRGFETSDGDYDVSWGFPATVLTSEQGIDQADSLRLDQQYKADAAKNPDTFNENYDKRSNAWERLTDSLREYIKSGSKLEQMGYNDPIKISQSAISSSFNRPLFSSKPFSEKLSILADQFNDLNANGYNVEKALEAVDSWIGELKNLADGGHDSSVDEWGFNWSEDRIRTTSGRAFMNLNNLSLALVGQPFMEEVDFCKAMDSCVDSIWIETTKDKMKDISFISLYEQKNGPLNQAADIDMVYESVPGVQYNVELYVGRYASSNAIALQLLDKDSPSELVNVLSVNLDTPAKPGFMFVNELSMEENINFIEKYNLGTALPIGQHQALVTFPLVELNLGKIAEVAVNKDEANKIILEEKERIVADNISVEQETKKEKPMFDQIKIAGIKAQNFNDKVQINKKDQPESAKDNNKNLD